MLDFITSLTLPELIAVQWVNNLLRYFLIAGLAYLILWKWWFATFRRSFLYRQRPASTELKREIFFSVLSTGIMIIPTLVVVQLYPMGLTKIYVHVSDYPLWWYGFSFMLVLFLHDTYFYWTHRLMHHPKLYRWFHHTHHLSLEPGPMAAYAFHPLETLVEIAIFLILPLTLPLHWSVLFVFTLFSLIMNVYGHLGFHLFSAHLRNRAPLSWLLHSTHHSWHHRYVRGNYGFYFQWWDRWMGTYRGELPMPSAKMANNAEHELLKN